MEIRILKPDDKEELFSLIKVIEQTVKEKSFWLPIGDASRKHFFDREWTVFFGAFENQTLLGALGLFLNENEYGESKKKLGIESNNIAEVGRAMCRPECRGKGVASALMNKLLEYVAGSNIEILLATVHPDNEPSQRLLRGFGFSKKGSIVKYRGYERDIMIRRMRRN